MCEFAPARARREAQGSRANRTLARPSCPAPMALVTFPERKVTRSPGRRAERDMDVVVDERKQRTSCATPHPPFGHLLPQGERFKSRSPARRLLQEPGQILPD